ncbi:hypothetical protein [Secundilactobacillus silagei]|uniref:hypothetical protein n=1 Tax=Secundilactobacillus silagei TaxID=1293415 RepID=UPI000AABE737|nr:hypothetical protein [Secundilactobacillus silagei]
MSAGLITGVGAISTTANAATYHKGFPKSLRNTKWRGRTAGVSAEVKFGKSTLYYAPSMGGDPQYMLHTKYRYLGHHVYYLKGRVYDNAPAGGISWSYKVKRYNSHKLYFRDMRNSNIKGMFKR